MPHLTLRELASTAVFLILAGAITVFALLGNITAAIVGLALNLALLGIFSLILFRLRRSDSRAARKTDTARSKIVSIRLRKIRAEAAGLRVGQQLLSQSVNTALEALGTTQQSNIQSLAKLDRLNDTLVGRLDGLDRAVAELAARSEADLDEIRQSTRNWRDQFSVMEWQLRKLHPEMLTDIQAMHQLFERYSPQAALPPVAGWAVSPSGLLTLTDLIEQGRTETIVECGSGASTLWMALALQKRGAGRLISLEHQREYVERTQQLLEDHKVTDWAEVRYAPLRPTETPRGELPWYTFDPATLEDPIDLLLVDGPPATTGSHARYPALPVLAPYLAQRAMIVADDADRQDEREMVTFWESEEPRLRRISGPKAPVAVLELA